MSTSNFCYQNRCIVVSNDDIDINNVPAYDTQRDNCRSYPSYLLSDAYFNFHDVFITFGYYEAACLDYCRKEENHVEARLNYIYNYRTKKEFVDDVISEFGLSRYRVNKLIGSFVGDNLSEYLYNACDVIYDYLCNIEEARVNEYLDNIKRAYCYDEYMQVARFSNGETIYEKK